MKLSCKLQYTLYTLTKWQVIFRIMTGKVLMDMTPCPLVNSYQHFGGACLHLQGQCSACAKFSWTSWTLKMEAIEMLIVVFFLLGDSSVSEFYVHTFQYTLSVPSS